MKEYLNSLNWLSVLAIVVAVEMQIGNGTMSITNMFPETWVPYVKVWMGNLGTVGALILAEGSRGRVSASSLPSVQSIGKLAIMLAVILACLTLAPSAHAAQVGKKQITKAQATANPLVVLQTFTETDLQAALADATANNDTAAVNCYTALLPIVQSGVANPLPAGLGGFQLLQKARDAKTLLSNLQSPNGPLAKLNIACAPLIIDAQNTMIQLGIVGGGVIAVGATGGVALPGLQGLLASLGGL